MLESAMHLIPVKMLTNALRIAGPSFFLSLQASSVQSALKIQESKSVGEFSPLPFVSLLTNCIIWSYYGALRSDLTVLLPNAIGIAAGAFGCYTFQKYASIPGKVVVVASIIVGMSTILASQGNAYLVGLIGCALSVVLSGSPLATVSTVIKTKSTASLPFFLCLSTFLNAASWTLYGIIIANDPMIYGPNVLAVILATIQLALFAVFGYPKTSSKGTTPPG